MSRIEELEKRLGADPNSRIFVQLAEEYRKAGMLEQAIEVCETGLQKHPQYPSARVALGRALLEAESFDRASEEFETVLQQVPDNILANKFLGETYEKLGRHEEALQKYEIAHTLAPEDPDLEERINAVEKVLREGPPAPAAAPAAAPTPAPSAPPPPTAPTPDVTPPAGEELEPTLFDGPPPGEPVAPPPPEPGPAARLEDDLAPIPLVEVDGPMELEDRFAAPPSTPEPAAAPPVPAPTPVTPAPSAPPPAPTPPATPEAEQVFEAELEPPPVVAPEPTPPPPPPPHAPPAPQPPPPAQAAPPPPPPPPPPQPPQPPPPPPPAQAPPTPAPPAQASAPPAPAPSAPARPQTPAPASAPASQQEMETRTMAELYASQGHLDQAIEVYRKLLEKSPDSMEYRTRLDELTMLLQATQVSAPPPPQRQGREDLSMDAADQTDREAIKALEGWLDNIRKSKDAE